MTTSTASPVVTIADGFFQLRAADVQLQPDDGQRRLELTIALRDADSDDGASIWITEAAAADLTAALTEWVSR